MSGDQTVRGRELRNMLYRGQRVYGTALEGYNQPRWPRLLGALGLDFVFMDNEHTPLNRETVAWAAQAYAANGIAPLLRIPEPSTSLAAMGIDLGAHGIIVPYVESTDQVNAMIGAIKYRPLKGAALQAVLSDQQFPSEEIAPYLEQYNADTVLIIMIESLTGINNLAEILKSPGVDGVLIGPHDLSVSCGVPEQYDHSKFRSAIMQIIEICQTSQVSAGLHYTFGSADQAVQWMNLGFNLICYSSDTLFVARGIQQELGHIRQALDGDRTTEAAADNLGASGHGT